MRRFAFARHKPLAVEPLEPRRVLSAVSVTNNSDIVNGDVSSVDALVGSPGEDGISLREAIEATNATPGADEIEFEFGHDGPETVVLGGTELHITDNLTIDGPGAELLVIDGAGKSRVMNFDDGDDETAFSAHITDVTIRGGATEVSEEFDSKAGGGIHNAEELTLANVVIRRNTSILGGGIFNGASGILTLLAGRIEENESSSGGGIVNRGTAIIVNSMISRNVAGTGGGILEMGELFLTNSHVISNSATNESLQGGEGGVFVVHFWWYGELHSTNSIIANNVGGDVFAVPPDNHGHPHAHFYGVNIVSDSSEVGSNILNVDPMLDEYGVPVPGSPAIDAGDTSLSVDQDGAPLRWDARGRGHHRVLGDGVDIGAFEAIGILPGDANQDGAVAFSDFLILSSNFGKTVDAVWEDGDFNSDGNVTFADFLTLSANFGQQTSMVPTLTSPSILA